MHIIFSRSIKQHRLIIKFISNCSVIYEFLHQLAIKLMHLSYLCDQKVPGAIPSSAVGLFPSGEVSHSITARYFRFSMSFVHASVFGEEPCTLIVGGQGRASNRIDVAMCD